MNGELSSLVRTHSVASRDRSGLWPVRCYAFLLVWQAAVAGLCGEFAFRHHYIDRDLPGGSYGQTCLVDVDRDGDLDFITGGKDEHKSVYWFEFRSAGDWVRHTIGVNHPSDVGGTALDVDGDGWLDHVAGGV